MKKIGLMGGTFDPIHLGHLMIGQQALEEYRLDEIWYMPSRIPPHKKDHTVTPAKDRCAMVQAAIAPYPGFVFSDFELKRTEGNTYTADTLRLLKEEYPAYEFYFIVGADSIHDIEKWYHPEYVLREVIFLAADREYDNPVRSLEDQIAYLTKKYNARIYRLHCRMMNIASAEIRERLAGHRPVTDLIPESVLSYIRTHDLYLQ